LPKTLLFFIGSVLIYSAFLTRTYYWDGVLFSLYVEKVRNAELPPSILFHPNHLLYSGFGYILYSFVHSCGLHLRAITLLQLANVFASTFTAVLIFRCTKRLSGSNRLAAFCCLLFASGATWWKFSTDADSYIPSVLLLVIAVDSLLGGRRSLVIAGGCHVLAMLFHELAIFAYLPILTAVFLEDKPQSERIRRACVYMLSTSLSVTLVYFSAYWFAGRGSGRTFLGWITSFSAESQMTHSWQQIVIGYPASYLKLLGGGKLSLVREYFSAPVFTALLLCLAALLGGVLLMRRPRPESANPADRRAKAVLWAWVLPYLLFLAWWEPQSAFYKLFIWPPAVLLFGCFIAERSFWMARLRALIAVSTALAAWNFGAFIFPHSHSSADPILALAETINQESPRNVTVYYRVLSPDDWYLQYFAPGRRWLPLPGDTRSLQPLSFESVCLETTALESVNVQTPSKREWRLVNSKHNVRFACW
jgi:hypothetical protein